jgi:hypothetical protein
VPATSVPSSSRISTGSSNRSTVTFFVRRLSATPRASRALDTVTASGGFAFTTRRNRPFTHSFASPAPP